MAVHWDQSPPATTADGNLTDIKITFGIRPNPMRCEEVARSNGIGPSKPRSHVTFKRKNADPCVRGMRWDIHMRCLASAFA